MFAIAEHDRYFPAVDPIEIREMLMRHSFIPFRVHMSDGNYLDIPHPEFALLRESSLHVGYPATDLLPKIPRHARITSPEHIVRLELEPAAR